MTFFLNGGPLEITSLVPLYFVSVEEKIRPYLYFVSVEEKIRPYFYSWVVQKNLFWREHINQHILICHQGLQ